MFFRYGKLIQIGTNEGQVAEEVGKYLQEGRKLAAILGPTFNRAFLGREKSCDDHIKGCVEEIVGARRIFPATPSEAESSGKADQVDSKQGVKGRARAVRKLSNSQGV